MNANAGKRPGGLQQCSLWGRHHHAVMQGIGVGVEVKRGNKKYGHLQAFGAKRRQESEVQVESSFLWRWEGEIEKPACLKLKGFNSLLMLHLKIYINSTNAVSKLSFYCSLPKLVSGGFLVSTSNNREGASRKSNIRYFLFTATISCLSWFVNRSCQTWWSQSCI